MGADEQQSLADRRLHGGAFHGRDAGHALGHAGTIVEGKADTTVDKIERMQKAGISVAERIEEIPALIKERLGEVA